MQATRRILHLEQLESRLVPSLFYVAPTGNDSNDGSSQHPWLTLQHASDSVVAGDTVTVKPGTYAGFVMGWDFPQSGTASNPITFQARPGVVINRSNIHTGDGIDLEYSSYIVIKGFHVNNTTGTITRAGIRAAGEGTGDVISDNTTNGCGTWGIFTGFTNNILISNNVTSNSRRQHGIYVSNASVNPTVINNVTYGNAGCGIQLNGDLSQGGTGLITGAVIAGNIIYNNGTAGGAAINLDGVQDSAIENNLLYDNHAGGIALYQIDGAAGPANDLVLNNTIVMPSDGRWDINLSSGGAGNVAYNNVLYNSHPNRGSIEVDSGSLPGFISDYNVVNDAFSLDSGNSVLSLAQWQAQTGLDTHSILSTPSSLFVDPGNNNYHLSTTSPAIDAGTSTDAPAADLDGNPRPTGSGYDIGAYEYQFPATQFGATAVSSSTAGSSFSLTIAAEDAYGHTTSYSGTMHFSSSDSAAGLPADYTFQTSDHGVHTFSRVILKTAGDQTVTVTDTAHSSIQGSATVAVVAAAARTLTVAGFPSPTTAGAAQNFTVTARDAYGNVAIGYTGTVHFGSNDGHGVLPANYTFQAADAGTHTFAATFETAGTRTLRAGDTVTGSIGGAQSGIVVQPAATSSFKVGGFPSPTIAGAAHSFQVTARDVYGNVTPDYAGTVHFTSSDAGGVLPADYTFTAADGGTHSFTATLVTAGSRRVTATDTVSSSISGGQSITVKPAAAATLVVAGFPSPTRAGAAQGFTVTALDPYGNRATGYLGTVHFTSSDNLALLPADYTFAAADSGRHAFRATLQTVGTQSITATDSVTSTLTGTQAGIQVTPAATVNPLLDALRLASIYDEVIKDLALVLKTRQ